jgi:hypothetical protein
MIPSIRFNLVSLLLLRSVTTNRDGRTLRSGGQARPSDTFKQFFKLRGSVVQWVIPKLITLILDELNECYQETPWVWAMENEPLENNTCYLLLDGHILFTEQVEHHAGELMSMT